MELKKYNEITESQYRDYIEEWEATGVRIAPAQSARDNESFDDLQKRWYEYENDKMQNRNMVPATIYFLLDKEKIVGAIDFRHRLNSYLEMYGGNIGYGIRPSERMKGYGKVMLSLLLEKLRKQDLDKVLITCFGDNVGSSKIIESCGGILESIIDDGGREKKRYWIKL